MNFFFHFYRISIVTLIILSWYLFPRLCAQTFKDIGINLPGPLQGSVEWGDFDNDNDLDVLVNGRIIPGGLITKIYQNNGNDVFIDVNASFLGLITGQAKWSDYDNDSYLDFLLTGKDDHINRYSIIYRNEGNGNFNEINAGLQGVQFSSSDWLDYDNDGDYDLLLTGGNYPNGLSKIYINNKFNFSDTANLHLPGVEHSSVGVADYDNDQDIDIFLTGAYVNGNVSKIFRNDRNNTFTDINASIPVITSNSPKSVAWGDYDNDGDLDLLTSGYYSYNNYLTKIYRNDGNDQFTDVNVDIIGIYQGSVAFGDYDNDGYLDVLITGKITGFIDRVTKVYHNEGNDVFVDIQAPLLSLVSSCAEWGDYDSDGDLDIVLTGSDYGSDDSLKIYKNTGGFSPNIIPTAPTNLTSIVRKDTVFLSWNSGTDVETPNYCLTYNIRMGTTPQGIDVISPMSDLQTGLRRIAKIGNVYQNKSWFLENLGEDKYYWSVQSIDHELAGSPFADEVSFIIAIPPESPHDLQASFINNSVKLVWSANKEKDLNYYKIYRNILNDSLNSTFIDSVFKPNLSYRDTNIVYDSTYYYWLTAVDSLKNESNFSKGIRITIMKHSSEFTLYQNFPNPFNSVTTISFYLKKPSEIILELYNVQGKKISTLMKRNLSAGGYQFRFKLTELSSGMYFYRLTSIEGSITKKILLFK